MHPDVFRQGPPRLQAADAPPEVPALVQGHEGGARLPKAGRQRLPVHRRQLLPAYPVFQGFPGQLQEPLFFLGCEGDGGFLGRHASFLKGHLGEQVAGCSVVHRTGLA